MIRSSAAALTLLASLALPLAGQPPAAQAASAPNAFKVTNLVTDSTGAPTVDADLVNPWGMAQSPSSPVWISNNGSGTSTLYAAGTQPKVPLTVTIPGGDPTGQVYNPTSSLLVAGSPAVFIFDSEAGTITAWASGTQAVTETTVKGAVFKGLALVTVNGQPELLATDFHNNRVDVVSSSWKLLSTPQEFRDPSMPAGYAPFGIAVMGGGVYVSYAKQDSDRHDDVAGRGNGYVDLFRPTGELIRRLITRGSLDSPWALTLAPAGFGPYAGDLIVGNFGNGYIDVYDRKTGHGISTLYDGPHHLLDIAGLWGLLPGNSTSASRHALMFTAGPGDEAHGRWGVITAIG